MLKSVLIAGVVVALCCVVVNVNGGAEGDDAAATANVYGEEADAPDGQDFRLLRQEAASTTADAESEGGESGASGNGTNGGNSTTTDKPGSVTGM